MLWFSWSEFLISTITESKNHSQEGIILKFLTAVFIYPRNGCFNLLPSWSKLYEITELAQNNVLSLLLLQSKFLIRFLSGADYLHDTIREIVSPATGLAVVTLVTDGRTHRIKLPVGSYQYEVDEDDKPCQIAIEVKGMYNLFRVSVIYCICDYL